MGDAIKDLLEHYPHVILTPKALSTINLVLVCGGVYGTRVMAYNLRKMVEKEAKKAAGNLHVMPQPAAPQKPAVPDPASAAFRPGDDGQPPIIKAAVGSGLSSIPHEWFQAPTDDTP